MSAPGPTPHVNHFDAIEAHFAKDAMSKYLGIEILEVSPTAVRLEMTVLESMVNAHGTCHGGMIFALADSVFALACNMRAEPMTAAGASIEFLAPAALGERLSATSTETMRTERHGIYDVVVEKRGGGAVAHFRGRCARFRSSLLQSHEKGNS